jgi:outer membrane protein TolC
MQPPNVSRLLILVCLSGALSATAALAQEHEADAESGDGERRRPVLDLAALTYAARENYPRLRAARHKVVAAEAQLDEALVSPFFQFSGTAAITIAPEARGTPIFSPDSQLPLDNPWRPIVVVGASGALPIYTFGKIDALHDAARAGVRAANRERQVHRDRVEFDVRRAYYGLQLSLDIQQMISEGADKLREAEEQLLEMLDSGDDSVQEQDRYRLATARAEMEARRSEAVMLERTTRHALTTLTGIDEFEVPECPLQPLELDPRPLREYQAAAEGGRPELEMLEAGIDAREANVEATRARYYPDLAITAAASYSYGPGIADQSNPFIIDQANFASVGAGLVARWSFDVWGNYHRVRRAEAELHELISLADEARRGVSLEVANAWEGLADARRREQAWEDGHRQARRWFISAGAAYSVGTVEPRDLIDAAGAYFRARTEHLKAINDVNAAIADLQRTTGTQILPAGGWEVRCEE